MLETFDLCALLMRGSTMFKPLLAQERDVKSDLNQPFCRCRSGKALTRDNLPRPMFDVVGNLSPIL